jgi:hypothetical protein
MVIPGETEMAWTVKGQGEPIKLADSLGAEIRGIGGEVSDSWRSSLHHVIAANVEQSVRLIGIALVSKDLHERRNVWIERGGPEPEPLLAVVECSGDVNKGDISFSVSVRLVED